MITGACRWTLRLPSKQPFHRHSTMKMKNHHWNSLRFLSSSFSSFSAIDENSNLKKNICSRVQEQRAKLLQCLPDLTNSVLTNHPGLMNSF